MAKFTDEFAIIAVGFQERTDLNEHIAAVRAADNDLDLALTLFASGAIGSVQKQLQKNARDPKAARNLNEIAMDVAAEVFLKGLIFGLKMAESGGIRFDVTPEGITLQTDQEMTH